MYSSIGSVTVLPVVCCEILLGHNLAELPLSLVDVFGVNLPPSQLRQLPLRMARTLVELSVVDDAAQSSR